MDAFVDERDYRLLERDRYTFFVLRRIIGGDCSLLLSDHRDLILCYTGQPYPVWIWTANGVSSAVMEKAYGLAAEHGLIVKDMRFNVKYELAEYLTDRAARDGMKLSVSTNMFAYDCPEPVKPAVQADGCIHRCGMEDLDELAEFLDLFHREIGIDQKDALSYREDARRHIETGNMYLWKDGQGSSVASCKYAPSGGMAAVNLVFTRPAYRRRHYAENLVYRVTVAAKEAGYLPMLYTDADYAASNACYEKIGYVLRGKLCTVAVG
ncbi:MAG: GNAT family N-acetyltransferase [Clostridia bacterium]|nr:GNAT family N-acetyltransferase [Clostridia bacterium]